MNRLLVFVAFLSICVLNTAAAPPDVAGEWKGMLNEGREVTLVLEVKGAKLSGTMTDAEGKPRPITAGRIDADKLDFTVASEWEGQPVTLRLNGTVKGDELRLAVRSEDGGWESSLTAKKAK